MILNLKGKRALVCGASQGIGFACAIALAECGADVVLVARNEANLKVRVAEINDLAKSSKSDNSTAGATQVTNHDATQGANHNISGKKFGVATYLVLDLSNQDSLKTEIPKLVKEHSGFDILVCNAGGPKGGPLLSTESEDFIQAFQTHVLTNSYLAQTLTPHMKKNSYGRIINIISTSVKAPIPNLGVSNTIRAAVASWAKTLAHEVGSYGITVNNILPGFTKTSRLESLKSAAADKKQVSESEIEKEWLATIPANRFGEASEVASAVAFLASPLASYINGINLPVDGGRTQSL